MWRFLRKRRALRTYRTKLFHQLRDTFGRKLYYSSEEVVRAVRDLQASDEFVCYALGMYCDQATFDAYHAQHGQPCDYGAMRTEVFAHLEGHAGSPIADAGCEHGHHGHHDTGHHGYDSGGHGGDFGGGHHH